MGEKKNYESMEMNGQLYEHWIDKRGRSCIKITDLDDDEEAVSNDYCCSCGNYDNFPACKYSCHFYED